MAAIVVLIGHGAGRYPEPNPVETTMPSAEPISPTWVAITRPFAAFDLAGGPYAKLPMRHEALRGQHGTARQDILTYGIPQPGDAFLSVLFYRHGDEPTPDTTLFVDTARLAGSAGLAVIRSGLAFSLPTRFGAFETAGALVSRAGRSSPCLGFRRVGSVLSITGLICGADAKPVDLEVLACTLDKLDLVSAGDDVPLQEMFAAAERQRRLGCVDAGVAKPPSGDPLRPVGNALRGSLPLAGAPGSRRQLSGSR